MNKFIFLIYIFLLNQLVTVSCNCFEECYKTEKNSCPEIKYVEGGLSGTGGLSRHWNCCKQSCSSTANAGAGNEARQCDSNMTRLFDYNAKSKCEGGPATTCLSYTPFVIDGCDDVGYGFGAVSSTIPSFCGKCFLIEFTGEGVWTTKDTHRKLKGKKLIFMAVNKSMYGEGTFDLLLPGGGTEMYPNGCDGIFSGDLGAQWGGILADCQEEAGMFDTDKSNNERKLCHIRKCNEAFEGEAREGCLFGAFFLEAALDPQITYNEIECPQILKDKY